MTIDFENEQRKELEILSSIYTNEMTIIKSTAPFKFKIHVKPLLEANNYNFHWEYQEADVIITFELGGTYPLDVPYFFVETNSPEVSSKSGLHIIEDELRTVTRTLKGECMIYDVIECARGILYHKYAIKSKHFNKRAHVYHQDDDIVFIDEAPEIKIVENLVVKDTYTVVTKETFTVWKSRFMAERLANKEKDPGYRDKMSKLAKPSGRQIFEKQKTLSVFYEDDKADEDDQDVDINKLRAENDVEIDEDAFADEDDEDLDDVELEDEEEFDEEKEVERLFL